MLRIFGFYSFGNCRKSFVSQVNRKFKIKSMFSKVVFFSQGSVSLTYELFKTNEAGNFYFIDQDKQLACFVVGNIHSYENSSLKILTGQNIAKWIINKYQKNGLKFVKYLRGNFNIIIVDKKKTFLINDSLGLSPMYIYHMEKGYVFCNEPEPIVWLNMNNRIDYNSVAKFIVYGFVPDGKTFIRGLYNQDPGTILTVANKNINVKDYFDFKPVNISGMPEKERIRVVRDVFRESVQIRINENDEYAFSELSGGWDTRFILANLVSLNRKVFACTDAIRREDLVIAKKIIRKMNLAHYIREKFIDSDSDVRLFYDLAFLRKQTEEMAVKYKQVFPGKFKNLVNLKYFTSSRFTGLFGTEVFGFVPFWFERAIKKNLLDSGSRILTKGFLLKALRNKSRKGFAIQFSDQSNVIYDFLVQISRTYLSVHASQSWARPTKFFSFQFLHPFADSKFVSLISAFEYNKYMPYKLYEKVFERYFPSYLKIPWTYQYLRKRNDINKMGPDKKDAGSVDRMIYRDKKFISFLKKGSFSKADKGVVNNPKELYFLFNWFKVYKSVLDPSDVHFFAGDTFN